MRVPEDDDRERAVCDHCGHIQYQNPKIVVGSVVHHDGKILLCKRAIEPRRGFWTLPAGYLELHETAEDGARREAREEALAQIDIVSMLAVYAIPRISQIQLMYRARLADPEIGVGPESLEAGLFRWEDIPWPELAFPSVFWALTQDRDAPWDRPFAPFTNPEGNPIGPLRR